MYKKTKTEKKRKKERRKSSKCKFIFLSNKAKKKIKK